MYESRDTELLERVDEQRKSSKPSFLRESVCVFASSGKYTRKQHILTEYVSIIPRIARIIVRHDVRFSGSGYPSTMISVRSTTYV